MDLREKLAEAYRIQRVVVKERADASLESRAIDREIAEIRLELERMEVEKNRT